MDRIFLRQFRYRLEVIRKWTLNVSGYRKMLQGTGAGQIGNDRIGRSQLNIATGAAAR